MGAIPKEATAIQQAIKVPQREVEAFVGLTLMSSVGRAAQNIGLKKSKLIRKEAYLPKSDYTMHYLEREAIIEELSTIDEGTGEDDDSTTTTNDEKNNNHLPTLIFCHGIGGQCTDFVDFINKLKIPSNVRILIPEQAGHGKDIERAKLEGVANYIQPTHETMLESSSEWLDEVHAGDNCNIFGISMGGAVAYYLHHKRPDKIRRAVLVSPAIPECIDKDFIESILNGTNNFFCFESREDVKMLMRDLSTGREDDTRTKKDPVPKFFYETIYRLDKKSGQEGHKRALLTNLLKGTGLTHSGNIIMNGNNNINNNIIDLDMEEEDGNAKFRAVTDIHEDATRLVMWPNKDQLINYERGKSFFEDSTSKGDTQFETIPDCGHCFHENGAYIMKLIRPRTREYLLEFN